eukprot:c22720_g1_i1 orf=2-253(-)
MQKIEKRKINPSITLFVCKVSRIDTLMVFLNSLSHKPLIIPHAICAPGWENLCIHCPYLIPLVNDPVFILGLLFFQEFLLDSFA